MGRNSSKSPETESRSIFLGCSVSSRAQFPEVVSREISRAAPEQVIFAEMVERLSSSAWMSFNSITPDTVSTSNSVPFRFSI